MTGGPDFLRAGEIARLLGVSERTVRRWIRDEIVPSVKIVGARLVAREDLDRLLNGGMDPGSDDDPEED